LPISSGIAFALAKLKGQEQPGSVVFTSADQPKAAPENFTELAKFWQFGEVPTKVLMQKTRRSQSALYQRLREH